MKKYLLFLLSFFSISALIYLFQAPIVFAYQYVMVSAMSFWSGQNLTYFYDSSFRLLVLVALLLATPGIPVKRRFLFSLYGLLSLWTIDLISFAIWTTPPPLTPGLPVSKFHLVYSLVWRTLGHWVLPFVFWLIMVKDHLPGWLRSTEV